VSGCFGSCDEFDVLSGFLQRVLIAAPLHSLASLFSGCRSAAGRRPDRSALLSSHFQFAIAPGTEEYYDLQVVFNLPDPIDGYGISSFKAWNGGSGHFYYPGVRIDNILVQTVPDPSTIVLAGLGCGLALSARRAKVVGTRRQNIAVKTLRR
jgi:hypothetical protein